MKVRFCIHGLSPLVEGLLDVEDGPVPAVGWKLNFDAAGDFRVDGITGRYSALGESEIMLDLSFLGDPVRKWSPEETVSFFEYNDDLTAFTQVETGDWCHCRMCSVRKEREMTEYTAEELAQILDNVIFGASTGALSMLDEATMKWAKVHPELDTAQKEFVRARHAWWPGDPRRDTVEAWNAVVLAAGVLGERLGVYGDEMLVLCGRPSVYGPQCKAVRLENGCSYSEDTHTDRQEV